MKQIILKTMADRLSDMPFDDTVRFTANFNNKFFQDQMRPDFVADKILLEQLFLEEAQDEPLEVLSDGPVPQGAGLSSRRRQKDIFARSRRCPAYAPSRQA